MLFSPSFGHRPISSLCLPRFSITRFQNNDVMTDCNLFDLIILQRFYFLSVVRWLSFKSHHKTKDLCKVNKFTFPNLFSSFEMKNRCTFFVWIKYLGSSESMQKLIKNNELIYFSMSLLLPIHPFFFFSIFFGNSVV